MKRLLTLVAFFATLQASAQQVNPVPDYVFANRMSAGRNTVTDTAAYFSIGPRYGATRGMMPPMVVDTASFSANKRNGLLIFSVQKNKFLYWDSVGIKWAEMAGTAGTALTSADTAALLSTRAWRQKGIDSLAAIRIAGSGTTNYVSKFTDTRTVGNTNIFDTSTSVGIGTISPIIASGYTGLTVRNNTSGGIIQTTNGTVDLRMQLAPATPTSGGIGTYSNHPLVLRTFGNERMRIDEVGSVGLSTTPSGWVNLRPLQINSTSFVGHINLDRGYILSNAYNDGSSWRYVNTNSVSRYDIEGSSGSFFWYNAPSGTSGNVITWSQAMTLTNANELYINTSTDNGDFKLQVNGNALFSGNIRTAAPAGGTANDWRLGTVATVSPTSPNRTIEVSIGGTIYYIAAKTTND